MILSLNSMLGDKIGASDGVIGHVKDVYLDGKHWGVRYLVVDTGSWISGRQVLISPHSFGSVYQAGKLMLVNLTRKQIEDSPSIDAHKPISRHYEEDYLSYFGWPMYWEGEELWGMSRIPVNSKPTFRQVSNTVSPGDREHTEIDAHLISAKAIGLYDFSAENQVVGTISDFLIDDQNWAVRHLVMTTGDWAEGKMQLISPHQIERISCAEAKIFLRSSRKDLRNATAYQEAVAS